MKIDLEYPYNQDWSRGYLVINPENRKTVILFNSGKDRSSTAYARYLLSVSIGRYLTNDEQADHINNDKTDDRIENLQVLTVQQNRDKETERNRVQNPPMIDLICPICSKNFKYVRRNHKFHVKNGRTNFYCSRECQHEGLKSTNRNKTAKKKVTIENLIEINNLMQEGFSSYRISEVITNISRGTIDRYMRQIRNGLINIDDLIARVAHGEQEGFITP